MLDFCEAVGRAIADDNFRSVIYGTQASPGLLSNLNPQTTKNKNHLIYTVDEYQKVMNFLAVTIHPSRYSYSLAVAGEVMRVIGPRKAQMDGLRAIIDGLGKIPKSPSYDYYAALGALTTDPPLRQDYITLATTQFATISTLPFDAELRPTMANNVYATASEALCQECWICGCFVRLKPYDGHKHPDPTVGGCE